MQEACRIVTAFYEGMVAEYGVNKVIVRIADNIYSQIPFKKTEMEKLIEFHASEHPYKMVKLYLNKNRHIIGVESVDKDLLQTSIVDLPTP